MNHHEVIVIGAGQAGLAIGHFLSRQDRDFTILEAAGRPALPRPPRPLGTSFDR